LNLPSMRQRLKSTLESSYQTPEPDFRWNTSSIIIRVNPSGLTLQAATQRVGNAGGRQILRYYA
jgi:hypothetical protein